MKTWKEGATRIPSYQTLLVLPSGGIIRDIHDFRPCRAVRQGCAREVVEAEA